MSLPPHNQMPPTKPKITPEERRRRTADRLRITRLRMAIGRELDERSNTTPINIDIALGMPLAEATSLQTCPNSPPTRLDRLVPTSLRGCRRSRQELLEIPVLVGSL
jgi:hypothetical protein